MGDTRRHRVVATTHADGSRVLAEAGVLPYLEVRLIPAHERITLGSNAKPKRTGETIPPMVEVRSGPAGASPATSSPARLRAMARMLETAADSLELELHPPSRLEGEHLTLPLTI